MDNKSLTIGALVGIVIYSVFGFMFVVGAGAGVCAMHYLNSFEE